MPLSIGERAGLEIYLDAITEGPQSKQPPATLATLPHTQADAIMLQQLELGERWLTTVNRLISMLEPVSTLAEKMVLQATTEALAEAPQAAQTPAPPKRTRTPRATPTNGASPPDASAPVATGAVAPPQDHPQPVKAPEPAAVASPGDELPDFLKRTGAPAAPAPAAAPAAPADEMDTNTVRETLKAYMDHHGPNGVDRLMALLAEFDATQIATLKKEHYPAIVKKARGEMLL